MASKPKVTAQERQWRAQDALSTLTRAQEIQNNKALMSDVRKFAQQQVKTLSTVAGKPAARKPR